MVKGDVKVTVEDGPLSRGMMIKAISTLMKETLPIAWPVNLCFSLCILTLALGCTMSPLCTVNFTIEVSLMECGLPETSS